MGAAIATALAIIFGALGDILLSKGMKAQGEVAIRRLRDIPQLIGMVFSQRYVLMGIGSMAVYFGSYIAALAWADVSIVNPLTALSYVIATIYAVVHLKEHVSPKRWAGVVLITLGCIFIGATS